MPSRPGSAKAVGQVSETRVLGRGVFLSALGHVSVAHVVANVALRKDDDRDD